MTPLAKAIRQDMLRISNRTGQGHIPTCFSVVEILLAAYRVMRHDPRRPEWDGRDLFILSKGHAALALYVVLARLGYFPLEDVFTFGGFGSPFGCHADRKKVPGVEASTGSLGHGIGMAVGAALAFRIRGATRRVYTVIGDGEANEGSVWEALLVAGTRVLPRLTVIYDNNLSHARGLQVDQPGNKFRAFGCDVVEVDGHDEDALASELARPQDRTRVVVAHTRKGEGCPTFVANHYAWHRRAPRDSELEILLRELDETAV